MAAIAGLAVICLSAGVWLSFGPLDLGPGVKAAVKKDVLPDSAVMDKLGKSDDYAVIYRRDLRKPLMDRAKPVAAPAPLKATLQCTMIESNRKTAIFQTTGGNLVEVEVGQMIEGDKVIAIQEGKVELLHNGSPIVLSVQEQAAPN